MESHNKNMFLFFLSNFLDNNLNLWGEGERRSCFFLFKCIEMGCRLPINKECFLIALNDKGKHQPGL